MNPKICFARFRSLLPAAFLVLFAGTVSAHPGHGAQEISGIGWGLAHPFTGLDHLLAMIAVGLWAVQMGGRALWLLPLSFLGAMAAGGLLGMSGIVIPQVEPLILGSALTLGALVAMSARLPLVVSAVIVMASALLHGQAHGAELPAGTNGGIAAIGFLAGTAALHGAGLAGGRLLQHVATRRTVRAVGAVIVLLAALLGLEVF